MIKKMGRVGQTNWESNKEDTIFRSECKDGPGLHLSLKKHFFLRLAANVVCEVNQQCDKKVQTYATKAMTVTERA